MKTITTIIKIISFFTILNLIFCINIFSQEKVAGKIIKSGVWNGGAIKFVSGEVAVKFTSSVSEAILLKVLTNLNAKLKSRTVKPGWDLIELPSGLDELSIIKELRKLTFVSTAEPNIVLKAFLEPNDPYFSPNQWALKNTRQSPPTGVWDADIDVPEAWDITTGNSSVILAILDSGIPMINGTLSHPDLDDPNKIILGLDKSGEIDGTVKDNHGHGTHVAGIAAAETNNGTGIAGISQNCRLLVIQVFDASGYGTSASFYNGVIEAVNYQRNHPGTRVVINFSGGGSAVQQMADAVDSANTYGIPIVASAGNDNGGPVNYPAAYSTTYSNVIAVSATDQNDVIAPYSSIGQQVTLSAPGGFGGYQDGNVWKWNGSNNEGTNIYSTEPNYPFNMQIGTDATENYGYLAGTSQAAPQVTGVIGLMLSVNSSLSTTQIRDILKQNADDKGPMGFDNQYGYGRTNAVKSAANAYALANPQYQYYVGTASLSLHSTDFDMTFLRDPAPGVSTGRYRSDRYLVQGTKGGFSQTPNGWITGGPGYSWANPNDASPYVIKSTTSNSITLQTVFYFLKKNIDTGEPVNKWAPFDPNLGSNKEFITLGTPIPVGPLSVSISGPTTIDWGVDATWNATATGGTAPYHYKWWYKYPGGIEELTISSEKNKKEKKKKKNFDDDSVHIELAPIGYWTQMQIDSPILTRHDFLDHYLKCEVTDAVNTTVTSNIMYIAINTGTPLPPLAINDLQNNLDKSVLEEKVTENTLDNFPNPFNPSTVIRYQIVKAGQVTLKVYDTLGREVANLVDKQQPSGRYSVNFNASSLSSGIYFYRITANGFSAVKKMMLLR